MYTLSGSNYEKIEKRQRDRHLKIIREQLLKFSAPLLATGLQLVSIELKTTSGRHFILELTPKPRVCSTRLSQDNKFVPNVAYLLLKYGVSFEFYHELTMLFKNLPRSYRVYAIVHVIHV